MRIGVRSRTDLDGRCEQFEREAVAGDAERRVEFGLGAVRAPLFDRRGDVVSEPDARPEFGALAILGIAFRRPGHGACGALFGFLVVDRDLRGAKLAFQVRRAALDGVEFGALFVVQLVDQGQLGHPAALLGLALPKLPKAFLCGCHGEVPAVENISCTRFAEPNRIGNRKLL